MPFSQRSVLGAILLLFISVHTVAQWKIVAPTLLTDVKNAGALHSRSGIVWAGRDQLWFSTDKGSTWQLCQAFTGTDIIDISFYDALNGLVLTDEEVFMTTDG